MKDPEKTRESVQNEVVFEKFLSSRVKM